MTESELKLIIDETAARDIWRRARSAGLVSATPRARTLRSIYYDTADHALRAAHITLRLRKDGRRWLQTVKINAKLTSGLSRTGEWEAPAPGGRIDLSRIECEATSGQVLRAIGDAPLAPVCETVIRRSSGVAAGADGTRAEISVDAGEILAGELSEPISELEVELIEGRVSGLYDMAQTLLPEGGLSFSSHSKSGRGYHLATTGAPIALFAPRRARNVALAPDQTAETAARDVLRECLAQIASNLEVVRRSDDPLGPHQLRVGLRRLRSAFAVFGGALAGPETTRLNAEARWLGTEAGHVRDLDVALGDIVARAAAEQPQETGFAALTAALERARKTRRRDLKAAAASARAQNFIFDLARYAEARGWLSPDDIDQTSRLAAPLSDVARAALRSSWKHSDKRARDLEALTIEARHDLRKSLKKLRYAVEFFAPVYPAKDVKPFLKRLKKLQDAFGDLNDVAMAELIFTGPDAVGAGDPDAQRAVGWILGASAARADAAWERTAALWRDLGEVEPYWR